MDSLLEEINSKRKALTELNGGGEPSKKYMRRADIERAKEDEERRKKSEILAAEKAAREEKRAAKMSKDVRLLASALIVLIFLGRECA
jgi:pre-mRNA-splicing factor 18